MNKVSDFGHLVFVFNEIINWLLVCYIEWSDVV